MVFSVRVKLSKHILSVIMWFLLAGGVLLFIYADNIDGAPAFTDMATSGGTFNNTVSTDSNLTLNWYLHGWGNSSESPEGLVSTGLASVNGSCFLFGGYRLTASGNVSVNETWVFDSRVGAWRNITTGTQPPARDSHILVALNDSLLLFGGEFRDDYLGLYQLLNDTWTYSLSTNTWSETFPSTPPPARHSHAAAVSRNSTVLLFGGFDGAALEDTWIYFPGNNSWHQILGSPSPPARYGHTMAAVGDIAVLYGGTDGSGDLTDTWIFNFNTLSWQNITTTAGGPPTTSVYAAMSGLGPYSPNIVLFG
ncbi:MAG: kelch repeat-containing protein, partial [Thermoplasmata archaeon]